MQPAKNEKHPVLLQHLAKLIIPIPAHISYRSFYLQIWNLSSKIVCVFALTHQYRKWTLRPATRPSRRLGGVLASEIVLITSLLEDVN